LLEKKIKKMNVFVTGATGFIGREVVKELLGSGHHVLGLARNQAAANQLIQEGASVFYGDLSHPESLIPAVQSSDAVIHLGFIHDFTRFKEMCTLDAKVIQCIGQALQGTQKPFIITSAIGILNKKEMIMEQDRAENSINPRVATEHAADQVALQGGCVSVIRLSPVVHDKGDQHGFIPSLIRIASQKGISVMINEGLNLWPAIHRKDAAKLYRLALEKNTENGARYHAVAESGIVFSKIAKTIGKKLEIPIFSISEEQTHAHFENFSHFARFNISASSKQTQEALDWIPTHPSLLEDLEGNVYFPFA